MFLAGVLAGSILGTTVCLVLAVLHIAAAEAEARQPVEPALVPLPAPALTRASLN